MSQVRKKNLNVQTERRSSTSPFLLVRLFTPGALKLFHGRGEVMCHDHIGVSIGPKLRWAGVTDTTRLF